MTRDETLVALCCRPHDYSSEGFNDWAFMTTHSWDEKPMGTWTLEIENVAGASDYGKASRKLPLQNNTFKHIHLCHHFDASLTC